MKTISFFVKATAIAVLPVIAMVSKGGISGTQHDLSTRGWGSTELCVFCHTPHNADKTVSEAPLWNHKVTTAAFTTYSSPTMNATVGQPGASSKLCLSCHDGTVAMDSFAGVNGTHNLTGRKLVGTDLGNDHPISITYDATLAANDGGLVTPVSATKVDAAGLVRLYAGKMECASCHDVHNADNGSFLRMENTGSALCLKCHIK